MTVIERILGASVPDTAPFPLFDTWKVWNDAMLFVDGYGAVLNGGRALSLRDTTKVGPRFVEQGTSETAAINEEFGRKVLTTVGVTDATAHGYQVPMDLIDISDGFTWAVIYRREPSSTQGTLFSIRSTPGAPNANFAVQHSGNNRVRTILRHRSSSGTATALEAISPVASETWVGFRGTVDWSGMASEHKMIYPTPGTAVAGSIVAEGVAGAPDWSGFHARILDKIYTATPGRLTGQLGAFIMMKGVLTGDALANFDARVIALAAAIDS